MSTIRISDVTLKQKSAAALTFKEKIELVKLLDRLECDVIELDRIQKEKADALYIKSVCETIKDSTISVSVLPDPKMIDLTWNALKHAQKPRISIMAPVSLVQMEYLYHKKPETLSAEVKEAVAYAKALCSDVEFCALDATRSEFDYLLKIMKAAAEAGATVLTIADTAANLFPQEAADFIAKFKAELGEVNAKIGVSCADDIALADACTISSAIAGAEEVKVSISPDGCASLYNVVSMIQKKGPEYDLSSDLRVVELKRVRDQADKMLKGTRSKTTPFDSGVRDTVSDRFFTANDSISEIIRVTRELGYDLSEEDCLKVYDEFVRAAARKQVSEREIDAIIASTAMQVPSAYVIENYIINSSSLVSSTAHIRLKKNGEIVESVAIGDGPVDASFLAIEQIVGRHYELDDFQIRSITEGREAMGETIVRLRSGGKLYSGRGLSTDIIGSSISAYINALNKIVYEEEGE